MEFSRGLIETSGYERAGFAALIVSTEDAVPDTIAGLTEAETRCGVPLTDSETCPANPCSADTVMVSVPLLV